MLGSPEHPSAINVDKPAAVYHDDLPVRFVVLTFHLLHLACVAFSNH